jgi:hypothetical protein
MSGSTRSGNGLNDENDVMGQDEVRGDKFDLAGDMIGFMSE